VHLAAKDGGEGLGLRELAITEPDAGANAHRISTVARREGEHY